MACRAPSAEDWRVSMAIYKVLTKRHELVPGDLLFGGEYFLKGGDTHIRFKAYGEMGEDKGFVHLPIEWLLQNTVLSIREREREGPHEAEYLRRMGIEDEGSDRRPSISERSRVPKSQLSPPLNFVPIGKESPPRKSSLDLPKPKVRRSLSFSGLPSSSMLGKGPSLVRSPFDISKCHMEFQDLRVLDGQGGSPSIHVEGRGQPALMGVLGDLLKPHENATGINLRDTCFVKNPRTGRNIAVLGWDHAMVVRQDKGRFHVVAIYAHASKGSPTHHIFGGVNRGKTPARLDTGGKPVQFEWHNCQVCKKGACNWIYVHLRPVEVEQIVTFQASSCSVVMLYDQLWRNIVISHMDASPPVPVGQIYIKELGKPRSATPLCVLASVYPEWEEMGKVVHSCSLLPVKMLFLRRGPLPPEGVESQGGWSNLESGLVFPPASLGPMFCGVIGAEEVYKNLIAKAFVKFRPTVTINQLKFWRDESSFTLDAILEMKDAELMKVYHAIVAQQFGKAQHAVLNAVGLGIFEELQRNPKGPLKALVQKDDKGGIFIAAVRAMLVYAIMAGGTEPLVREVITLVNTITPDLQLRFTVPLTAVARRVMETYIKRLD